jgi:hypothetical protein
MTSEVTRAERGERDCERIQAAADATAWAMRDAFARSVSVG